MEPHSQYSCEEYAYATCYLCYNGVGAESTTHPVCEAAHHAGHGVDVLTEDQGYLIDEHIAQHTSGSNRKRKDTQFLL